MERAPRRVRVSDELGRYAINSCCFRNKAITDGTIWRRRRDGGLVQSTNYPFLFSA